MKYRYTPGRLLELGKCMHDNWLYLWARNVLHKRMQKRLVQYTLICTFDSATAGEKRKKSLPSCSVTEEATLFYPFYPFPLPLSPLICSADCYIQHPSERACDESRQWYPDPTSLQPSEHHQRKHLFTWNRQGVSGADAQIWHGDKPMAKWSLLLWTFVYSSFPAAGTCTFIGMFQIGAHLSGLSWESTEGFVGPLHVRSWEISAFMCLHHSWVIRERLYFCSDIAYFQAPLRSLTLISLAWSKQGSPP